jgi:hypothetical protein
VIADMMEKDPAKRMQTAAECVERLSVWAKGSGPHARRLRSAWSPPPLPSDVREKEETGDFDLRDAEAASPAGPHGQLPGEETHGGGRDITAPLPSPSQSDSSILTPARSPWATVLITTAIAVPLALFAGSVMMWLFLRILGG